MKTFAAATLMAFVSSSVIADERTDYFLAGVSNVELWEGNQSGFTFTASRDLTDYAGLETNLTYAADNIKYDNDISQYSSLNLSLTPLLFKDISSQLRIYGKGGVSMHHEKFKYCDGATSCESADETDLIATLGLGVQMKNKSGLIVRLSYDHYFAEYQDIKSVNVTIGYSF
ncbi:outer membrane beta-barrel protein [Pseudomonadota bacterium]